jgi:anaerobic magnesium-protoporphyrin IX monomethyl ester cyclase
MRFLMLYTNQFCQGNKPIGIGSLAATFIKAGHEFQLFDTTQYALQIEGKKDLATLLSSSVQFRPVSNPERFPSPIPISYQGLVQEFFRVVDEFKPDMIGLSALTDDYPLGLGMMRETRRNFGSIPTIAGGIHPTVDPVNVIAEDCFDIVCVGEGEYVLLDIAERFARKEGYEGIANLWVKKDDGTIERNAVRPYEQNLDLFPFPDWSIYPENSFLKPYNGFVYRYGDFEMSRGCPYKCSYCVNVQLQEVYKAVSPDNYHREKSIDRVIDEIQYAIDHYDIEFLKFWDETFLLMSVERMQEFCDKYSSQIGLPYVIETTGQSITDFSAAVLRKTNCKSVSVGMETGNPDLRKGILHKTTENEVYRTAYRLLEENRIGKNSFNMIGLPGEYQEDIFRTIGMNRLLGTNTQSVGVFYPYKGTPIRDMMERQGVMGEDFEMDNLKDYDFNSFTTGNRSVVKFEDMDAKVLNSIWTLFSSYVVWPVTLFPLIDYVKNNENDFALVLARNVLKVTSYEKFGEAAVSLAEEGKPSNAEIGATLSSIAMFDEIGVAEFISRLAYLWRGEGLGRLNSMLVEIAQGVLKPDFSIPKNEAELVAWINHGQSSDGDLRQIRSDIRGFAKENSVIYSAV